MIFIDPAEVQHVMLSTFCSGERNEKTFFNIRIIEVVKTNDPRGKNKRSMESKKKYIMDLDDQNTWRWLTATKNLKALTRWEVEFSLPLQIKEHNGRFGVLKMSNVAMIVIQKLKESIY